MNLQSQRKLKMAIAEEVLNRMKCCFSMKATLKQFQKFIKT